MEQIDFKDPPQTLETAKRTLDKLLRQLEATDLWKQYKTDQPVDHSVIVEIIQDLEKHEYDCKVCESLLICYVTGPLAVIDTLYDLLTELSSLSEQDQAAFDKRLDIHMMTARNIAIKAKDIVFAI